MSDDRLNAIEKRLNKQSTEHGELIKAYMSMSVAGISSTVLADTRSRLHDSLDGMLDSIEKMGREYRSRGNE